MTLTSRFFWVQISDQGFIVVSLLRSFKLMTWFLTWLYDRQFMCHSLLLFCGCAVWYGKQLSTVSKGDNTFCLFRTSSKSDSFLHLVYAISLFFMALDTVRYHGKIMAVLCHLLYACCAQPLYEGSSKNLLRTAFHTQEQCMLDWFCS